MRTNGSDEGLRARWELLRERVQRLVGPVRDVLPRRGRHARSQCLELRTAQESYFLKLYDTGRGFEQERFFYERLAESFSGVARMVEQWPAERALLMHGVPGAQVAMSGAQVAMSGAQASGATLEVYRLAGEALGQLHRLPWSDRDMDLRAALGKRVEAFAGGCKRFLNSLEVDAVVGPITELLNDADGLSRVYCHRDYAEYNWLHGPEGFFVLDFEHAKADYWLLDLCLLKGTSFADVAGAEEAFWQGYGAGLSDWESAFLSRWTVMWAQQTRIWGERHGDEYCVRLGQRALRALGP